jgi:hypothetical protein
MVRIGGIHLEGEIIWRRRRKVGRGGVSPLFCRRNHPTPTQAHTHACMHIVFIHALHDDVCKYVCSMRVYVSCGSIEACVCMCHVDQLRINSYDIA